jgi:hypothetical protein
VLSQAAILGRALDYAVLKTVEIDEIDQHHVVLVIRALRLIVLGRTLSEAQRPARAAIASRRQEGGQHLAQSAAALRGDGVTATLCKSPDARQAARLTARLQISIRRSLQQAAAMYRTKPGLIFTCYPVSLRREISLSRTPTQARIRSPSCLASNQRCCHSRERGLISYRRCASRLESRPPPSGSRTARNHFAKCSPLGSCQPRFLTWHDPPARENWLLSAASSTFRAQRSVSSPLVTTCLAACSRFEVQRTPRTADRHIRLARTVAFDATTTDSALLKALQTLLAHENANGDRLPADVEVDRSFASE